MSKSKRFEQPPQPAEPRRGANWFLSPGGGLRTGWLLAASLLCYALAAMAARLGLQTLFSALFQAWGIRAENAHLAPAWARAVYVWHGSAVTVAVGAALLLMAVPFRRVWLGKSGKIGPPGGAFVHAALTGLGMALGIAAAGLALDSMRTLWPLNAPRLAWRQPILCGVSLFAALAEETFLKRVLYDGLRVRWGCVWATAIVCAVFFLSNGGYAGNVISGFNVLLLGALCCALYAKRGFWAAVGLRWGWSAAVVFLMGFGGRDSAVYRMFGVSEQLLTGGDAGPVYGLWATLAFAGALLWLEREWIKERLHINNRRRHPADVADQEKVPFS
ncbi:MAG: hypothetical protein IJ124_03875 [Clostridia bacterium]|nr:hypothetical protein [Clostridia bacterium]